MVFQYHKNLLEIISELQPSLERLGLFQESSCKSRDGEKSNPPLFLEKSDMLYKTREMGGGQFVDMLWASGLAKDILNSNEDITLIVPLSISNIPDSVRRKMNSACFLRQMLKHHVIYGKKSLSSLQDNDVINSFYETEFIHLNKFQQLIALKGAAVRNWDIEASGGFIHIVETLILPPDSDTESKGNLLSNVY